MDKLLFDRYKKNKKELVGLEQILKRLYEKLDNVPTVSGKVTKSSDEFPYIEEHITVKIAEPKEATLIKGKIIEKERRQRKLQKEVSAVEDFINSLPEGIEKQIFELVFVEGMSQNDVGESLGYSKGRISQKISSILKD